MGDDSRPGRTRVQRRAKAPPMVHAFDLKPFGHVFVVAASISAPGREEAAARVSMSFDPLSRAPSLRLDVAAMLGLPLMKAQTGETIVALASIVLCDTLGRVVPLGAMPIILYEHTAERGGDIDGMLGAEVMRLGIFAVDGPRNLARWAIEAREITKLGAWSNLAQSQLAAEGWRDAATPRWIN